MSRNGHILVVDDERSMREFLEIFFRREDYEVTSVANAESAILCLENDEIDLVITDMKMPEGSGLEVLHAARVISPETIVIVITAFASTEGAISAMKEGAYDYITKPFKVEEIRLVVEKALEKKLLCLENERLKSELRSHSRSRCLIGNSESMQSVFELITQVAATQISTLPFS